MTKQKIYFKCSSKLRIKFDELILNNKILNNKYDFIRDTDKLKTTWTVKKNDVSLAFIWGEIKWKAGEFIEYCNKEKIPYLIIERSPLLKNKNRSLYFDEYGITYKSSIGSSIFWEKIKNKKLLEKEKDQLNEYRKSLQGVSTGVEDQKSEFINAGEIKAKLKIPIDKKIIYIPLQVPNDITITDKHCNPWLKDIDDFIKLIIENIKYINEEYYLIFKKHPFGSEHFIPKDNERIKYISDEINANSLTQESDAVMLINSGTGTEALVFHKPVISFGKSFYSDKDIVLEVESESDIKNIFEKIDSYKPDKELIDKFINYMVFDFSYDLSYDEDIERLILKIKSLI